MAAMRFGRSRWAAAHLHTRDAARPAAGTRDEAPGRMRAAPRDRQCRARGWFRSAADADPASEARLQRQVPTPELLEQLEVGKIEMQRCHRDVAGVHCAKIGVLTAPPARLAATDPEVFLAARIE